MCQVSPLYLFCEQLLDKNIARAFAGSPLELVFDENFVSGVVASIGGQAAVSEGELARGLLN
ncbi:MAG: hypothetical protein V7721_08790 [Porticoccaceae bacterium]